MKASETRAEARKSLEGKWAKGVFTFLAFFSIIFVLSFIQGILKDGDRETWMSLLVGLFTLIITIPLQYGYIAQYMKLKRNEEFMYYDFVKTSFANFKRAWCIYGHVFLKIAVPFFLIIVSTIVLMVGAGAIVFNPKIGTIIVTIALLVNIASYIWMFLLSFLYSLPFFIFFDRPEMTNKEIVEESARLMRGNRMKYFLLNLSFIGWALLAFLIPLGLGYLWLTPYITIASIIFYEKLAGISNTVETISGPVENIGNNEQTSNNPVVESSSNDNQNQ